MCLRTKQQTYQIAEKDITCYKLLFIEKREDGTTTLYSPFYAQFQWELGKLYEVSFKKPCPKKETTIRKVNIGFHTYKNLEIIKKVYELVKVGPCVVVKCLIPKGSKYYTGEQSNGEGYVSDKLIATEIVSLKELYPFFNFDNYPYEIGDVLQLTHVTFSPYTARLLLIEPIDENTVMIQVGNQEYKTDKYGEAIPNCIKIKKED